MEILLQGLEDMIALHFLNTGSCIFYNDCSDVNRLQKQGDLTAE